MLRWLIFASLGVVAQNACGGRAMPGDGDFGIDDPGGAAGDVGRAGDGGSSGGTRATTPAGGTGGSANTQGGAAGSGEWGASGSAGAAGASFTGAAGMSGVVEDGYYTECASPIDLDGGIQVCANGMVHRPYAGTCPNALPRPQALDPAMRDAFESLAAAQGLSSEDIDALYLCREDTDCTERAGGYCTFRMPLSDWYGEVFTSCEYTCTSDADCGGGTVCDCEAPGGFCVNAGCFTNDDCAPGWRCLEYNNGADCGPIATYYTCQTPEDDCVTDADCTAPEFCQLWGSSRVCRLPPMCRGGQ